MSNPIWGNKFMAEKDNWENRSKNMICDTCIFYVVKGKAISKQSDIESFGRCRKHAPTLNGWPAIFNTDWCGDHKLDENKIDA